MGRLGKEAEDGAKQTRRRLDLDDDLDEVWAPRNPHLKHLKNVGDKKEKGGKMKVSNVGGNQVSLHRICTRMGFDIRLFYIKAKLFQCCFDATKSLSNVNFRIDICNTVVGNHLKIYLKAKALKAPKSLSQHLPALLLSPRREIF